MNTGGMQAARSIIGNTALASLAEPERRTFAGAATVPPGVYKSTFWDIELESRPPELVATAGLVRPRTMACDVRGCTRPATRPSTRKAVSSTASK